MVAVEQRATEYTAEHEDRVVLHGIPWSVYAALRDASDERGSHTQMTYLSGTLELMSPGSLHEDAKKIIARLIELWALECDVDLRGFGSTTFRKQAEDRGLEPDECYKLGKLDDGGVPDIAIEVVVTRPYINKLDVYAGLGVPEVWEWRPGSTAIVVHRLVGGAYEQRTRSEVVPALDLAVLSQFIRPGESHTALAKAYQAALRG
jgi:Uma2 family endonuclease